MLLTTAGGSLFSQCLNPFQYPVGSTGMLNDGQQYTISTTTETTKHSQLGNVQGGETYEFSVTRNGIHKYITIRQGAFNGSVVGHGMSPLQITTSGSLNLYAHWTEDASCSGSTLDHTTTYQCLTCTPPPPPSNDECDGAISFPAIPTDGTCVAVSSTTEAATESMPACTGAGADDDVWFIFTATATTHTFQVQNVTPLGGFSPDMAFEVFSGTCNNLTSLLCSDPNSATLDGLTVGNVYFIRVFTMLNTNRASFDLCISAPPQPPPNNLCSGAIPVDCTTTLPGEDATLANSADNPQPCSGSIGSGVWYSFTGTGDYLTVSVSPSGWNAEVGLYSGTCGSMVCQVSIDQTGIGGSETISDFPTLTGQPYAVFVSGHISGAPGGPFSLSLSCAPPPPPPANDECSGAFAFPSLPTDGTCVSMTGSTAGATESASACLGSADDDVWFSCVVPSDKLEFDINSIVPLTGTSTDMIVEVFTGSCGNLASVMCSDAESGVVTGLTPGSTCFIRVHTALASSRVSFDICLSSPPPPPANDFCDAAQFLNQGQNSGTTLSATPDWPAGLGMSCNVSYDNNVWFQFQAYGSDVTIDVGNISGDPEGVQLGIFELPSDCNSSNWTELDCVSPGNSDDFSVTLSNLVTGSIYLIIVDGWAGSENDYTLTITGGGPLPVRFIDFGGAARENHNHLFWEVGPEDKLLAYELHRSLSGRDDSWSILASIRPEDKRNYSFSDHSPYPATYYKLRAVDLNGDISEAPAIFIWRANAARPFVVYPNPSSGRFNVEMTQQITGPARLRLYDSSVRILRDQKLGYPTKNLVLSTSQPLPPGLYWLQFETTDGKWIEKLVVTASGE